MLFVCPPLSNLIAKESLFDNIKLTLMFANVYEPVHYIKVSIQGVAR